MLSFTEFIFSLVVKILVIFFKKYFSISNTSIVVVINKLEKQKK